MRLSPFSKLNFLSGHNGLCILFSNCYVHLLKLLWHVEFITSCSMKHTNSIELQLEHNHAECNTLTSLNHLFQMCFHGFETKQQAPISTHHYTLTRTSSALAETAMSNAAKRAATREKKFKVRAKLTPIRLVHRTLLQ